MDLGLQYAIAQTGIVKRQGRHLFLRRRGASHRVGGRLCHLHALFLPIQPEAGVRGRKPGIPLRPRRDGMNRSLKTGLSAMCLSFSFLLPDIYGAAGAPLPDSSLYQLKSEWATDAGARIRLESLRGKPRVLTLFFGHCESSCPMVLASLKIMESYLPRDWGEKG